MNLLEVLGRAASTDELTQKHFGCDGNLLHPEFFHLFKFNFLFSSTHKTIYHSADYPVPALPLGSLHNLGEIHCGKGSPEKIECPLVVVVFISRSITDETSLPSRFDRSGVAWLGFFSIDCGPFCHPRYFKCKLDILEMAQILVID